MRYYYDYSFPIGNLTIEEDGHGICGIYFGTKMLEGEKKNTELIREAALQLSQYFVLFALPANVLPQYAHLLRF